MSINSLLQLTQFCVKHHGRVVLGPVSLDINAGEKILLTGSNGGGKTTLLNALAGLVQGTGIRVSHARRLVFLRDTPPAENTLTVMETLLEYAAWRDVTIASVEPVLQRFHLVDVKHRVPANLSLGFRQRLNLALGYLSQSDVWLLDEPANGLDPEHQAVLETCLTENTARAVVLVSHQPERWQHWCSRVLYLRHGELLRDQTGSEFFSCAVAGAS